MLSKVSTRTLLACGVIAGPLFVVTFLVEGATRAHYNPLRHPVSTLELGEFGWAQTANFIIAGLLTLAFAIGLRRTLQPLGGSTWGPVLIGAWATHLVGAGIFVTDPVSGYPPGTSTGYSDPHGVLHDVFAVPGFLALLVTQFLFSRWFARRGEQSWAIYSAVCGVIFGVGFILANVAFAQVPGLVDLGGLFQRAAVAAGWTWLALLAVHRLRASTEPPRGIVEA